MRSTSDTRNDRRRPRTISDSSKAVPRARGTATTIAMNAIVKVPESTAAIPNFWVSGDHRCSKRNEKPETLSASAARSDRNRPTASMMATVVTPAVNVTLRKIESDSEGAEARERRAAASPFTATDSSS